MTTSRTARRRLPVLVAAGLLVGACSAQPPHAAAGPPTASQRVGLTEWEVVTQGAPLRPGQVTLTVTNAGTAPHDLEVDGRLGHWRTALLSPGEQATLVVQARAGEVLDAWCTVTGHDLAGMRTTLAVAATG